jgi:hypothetical protein
VALAKAAVVPPLIGRAQPRIAPPVPVRSDIAGFRETASGLLIPLRPWQEIAGTYLMATGPDGFPLYREVAIVVARQNGKTTLGKPFIVHKLREGRRITHLAQVRELPRKMFGLVAESLDESLFPKRRGKGGKMQTIWPRFGAGSEEILLANGGEYRIAAANRGGARGFTNDIVIIDELREMESTEIMEAAESTILTSPWGQIVYFSNAGTDDSVVLNALRERADSDPSLAYLEWSADPELDPGDPAGWVQANPSIGHDPVLFGNLERAHRRHSLVGSMPIFETENLCRWVKTLREALVRPAEWSLCETDEPLVKGRKAFLAVSMDPDGRRASAVLAWQRPDRRIALRVVADVTGDPVDVTDVAKDFAEEGRKHRALIVGFDPMTDAELAKHARVTKSITGAEWANASAMFVNLVETGRLVWEDAAAVGEDLTWTSRKEHDESGKFQAVRANDDRPITAALAAIRAVWLASGKSTPRPRIY